MALPKISLPLFNVKIPVVDISVQARPMTVKEEKILLMARQSEEQYEHLSAIRQVVSNCIQTKGFNEKLESMPLFVLEYLFTKIRSQSISNMAKVSFKDNEDEEVYDFDVDLEKVTIKKPDEEISNTIQINDEISVVLRQPSVGLFTSKEFYEVKEEDRFETLIEYCVETVFEGDKAHKNFSKEDLKEFVQSIPSKHFEHIQKYMDSAPTLYYKIEYKNKNKTKRTIELKSLDDFFMFG